MSITEIAIKRPLLITVIFTALLLFGYLGYRSLNYRLLPKFETNTLSISTTYKGASVDEVQTSITKPIEDAVAAIEGIDNISSTSQEGSSSINIELKSDADTKAAQSDAERKVNKIKASLPKEADEPVVSRFSSDDEAIMKISITSSLYSTDLYNFIDLQVKPLLTNIQGVADINIIGGTKRQINVALNNDKLRAFHVSILEIDQAISNSGVTYPSGSISNKSTRFSIDLNTKIKTVDDLRNVIIRQTTEGSKILLKDVASVTDGAEEVTKLNRINSVPAVGIEIKKQTDANTVKVCNEVKQKLKEIKETYVSKDFNYLIASDQSIYTLASANAVVDDIFMAILIVAAVMLFFLHTLRNATFVLIAIPSAMIPTFIAMWYFGFSLNVMSLMSLSLVVGILVDDSIVVLENIYRHMEMGKNKKQAALDGRNEIGFTALAITLVDVVVFLPLSLAGGMIGSILKEYAMVVVFATLMSLFVAFTLTPMMASRWGKVTHLSNKKLGGRINIWFESLIDQLRLFYEKILQYSLHHKRYIFILITALLIGTIALIPAGFVGTEFFSQADRGELNLQIDLASSTPLKQTNQIVAQVEKIILQHPEVENVFSNVGTQQGAAIGTEASGNSNLAEISVVLTEKNKRTISTGDFGKKIRDEISVIPGVKPTIKLVGMTGNSMFDIQMAVKGAEMDSIAKGAAILKNIVASIPGTDYVQYSTKDAKTQISIKLNRDKLSQLGLSVNDVGTTIQYAFKGDNNTKFKEKGDEYKINLQLDDADKKDINSIKKLNIYTSNGNTIPLEEIAEIYESVGQSILERKNRLNSIGVYATTVGRPAGTVMDEIQQKLNNMKLPKGIIVSQEGMSKNQTDSFVSLFQAIGIAILLMYLIMVALYESIIYPFVVMFSLPVAIVGAILALALTLNSINLFSLLGIIMLLGLVAKNAILIVDFTNQEKQKGLTVTNALLAAGKERLRPILMTTFSMIFGMLPMALATGASSETKNAMAWVIIGGLTSSMIFTLVLVPCVYMVVENARIRFNNYFSFSKK